MQSKYVSPNEMHTPHAFQHRIWQTNPGGSPHRTADPQASMKPGLTNLQSELALGTELPNKMNSQPLRGTQKKKNKKNARGRREEEGGEEGRRRRGGNKLNPVKLFFHSQWVWQRALTNTHKM